MEKLKILYFGNPYIKEDSLAIEVAKKLSSELKDVEFEYIKDTFELMDMDLSLCVLLDVADNIPDVMIVDSDKIKSRSMSTLHDFDLGFFINLNKTKTKIIVIPIGYDINNACDKVRGLINSLASQHSKSE